MSVVILCGGAVATRRHISFCPGRCQRRRRIVSLWDASPYYAPWFICCACGDSWSDGELGERPFAPRWRQKSIAKAKAIWDESRAGWPERDEYLEIIPD